MIGGAFVAGLWSRTQRLIQRLRGRHPDHAFADWEDFHRADALDGTGRRVIDRGRDRLIVAAALFGLGFLVLSLRLVDLALFGSDGQAQASRRAPTIVTERADIVDRNGMLLATALDTASLFADASKILDTGIAARELAQVLPGLNEQDLLAKLNTRRSFIWIRRNLTPDQEYQVNNLGLPGLAFQREPKRIYPHGRLAAHVLGFVDIDNHGLAGVEAFFDERLRNPDPDDRRLALSIDLRVQHALTEELANAVETYGGIGGAGVIMDVRTGEVVALASLPDFDPNYPNSVAPDARFNRVTLGVYEMGSTFKTFTTAMALDTGVVGLNGGYDATHPIRYGRFTISDDHPKARWLTVPEIFMYSSNIGSVRMALAAGTQTQRDFLGRLGLLRRSSLELPEQGSPLVPNPWREINTMTISFGHGLSVTPLQMTSAFSAIVNGGVLLQPTLVRVDPDRPPAGMRVISSETSNAMRRLLRLVVESGTGRRGEAAGYYVGGKTGTAEKAVSGGYRRNATLSSFLAAFPMQEPRFAVLIMIDEPKGNAETHGFRTGGWVAAPAVSRIVTRIAPLMGVPPVPTGEQSLQAAQLVSAQ
ncbi:peptidoglycan D,D-transpeptidase FtsI family protein [Zavarzinia sp. CC-PAN008]|uniref:peptidoglycan D,D-transpeptidase FtsI family protein n=1 Tax=Zavarzinia sp. CC-PAN008 TaxID=3243332 RepID=UPI003F745DF2